MDNKNMTYDDLIDRYMDHVVQKEALPEAVMSFTKACRLDEEDFFEYFKDIEAINKAIFQAFMDRALDTVFQSGDYEAFSKKEKLLSLYYTVFENLTLNRSFVQIVVDSYSFHLNALPVLNDMKQSFFVFIDSLQMETFTLSSTLASFQKKSLREGLWIQFLLTFKFWISDTSPQCEKTDIFIEKSINTGMELLNTRTLDHVIDLGKFLYAEKVKSKGQP